MPCRDYEDTPVFGPTGSAETREKLDKLSRIACIALTALEDLHALMSNDKKAGVNIGDKIDTVLTNKEVLEWWPAHKAADAAEQERLRQEAVKKAAAEERKLKRRQLINRLSDEDKKILGVK